MGDDKRYKDLQLGQLRSFALLARERSFTAVAQRLGMSVPTIWLQVRALERKLGTELLCRRGRAVELTPDGQLLLELIQPHVVALDSLERLFAARRTEVPQSLSLVATPYQFSHYLRRPIQEFVVSHPAVLLNLRVQVFLREVVDQLEAGQADLGVLVCYRSDPPSPHLEYEELFEQQFLLATTADHPLTRKRRVGIRDVVQYPLITGPPDSHPRMVLDHLLRQHNLAHRVRIIMESPSLDIIRSYVAAGIGVALIHGGKETDDSPPGLHVRPFRHGGERLVLATAVLKGAHLPAPVQAFRDLVRQVLGGRTRGRDD